MKINIIALFIIAFTVNLYAEAVNSGSSAAVNSESSFNAIRNPALMSRQQTENFSFAYGYSSLLNTEVDTDFKYGGVPLDIDAEISEDYNGVLYFSDVEHSGQSSYGFGISKASDGQIVSSSMELEGSGFSTTEDTTYVGATFMLSYSYKLNSTESFGIQIETAASSESKDTEKIDTPDEINVQEEIKRVTSGVTLGYYLLENNFQFGIMLKSGRYGVENQKYELDINGIESDGKISNYYMNDEGPGVLFGFGVKPERGYLLCIEAGYVIPYSHEEKSFDDDSFEKTEGNVNLKYAYVLRGGLSYDFSRYINIGIGGSYTGSKADSSDKEGIKSGSIDYSIFQLTSGIDIKPSKDYTIILSLAYNRVLLDMKNEDSLNSFKLGITEDIIDIMAGVSCNY
jgi:hypothetical protein